MKPNLQHAIEHVERPGGNHEGVGRKKNCTATTMVMMLDKTTGRTLRVWDGIVLPFFTHSSVSLLFHRSYCQIGLCTGLRQHHFCDPSKMALLFVASVFLAGHHIGAAASQRGHLIVVS